jgi:predicted kinase
MSKLIVVCGLGGTGKTTLANALSKELNIACIHKDSIKAILYDKLGVVTEKTFLAFKAFVEEQLANGVNIIIEATFDFAEDAQLLRAWQDKYELELVCIICSVDNAERKRRILSRERHISHQDADLKQLQNIEIAHFDYSIMPGKHIAISTASSLQESVRAATSQL